MLRGSEGICHWPRLSVRRVGQRLSQHWRYEVLWHVGASLSVLKLAPPTGHPIFSSLCIWSLGPFIPLMGACNAAWECRSRCVGQNRSHWRRYISHIGLSCYNCCISSSTAPPSLHWDGLCRWAGCWVVLQVLTSWYYCGFSSSCFSFTFGLRFSSFNDVLIISNYQTLFFSTWRNFPFHQF